jgi:hypothetical protein
LPNYIINNNSEYFSILNNILYKLPDNSNLTIDTYGINSDLQLNTLSFTSYTNVTVNDGVYSESIVNETISSIYNKIGNTFKLEILETQALDFNINTDVESTTLNNILTTSNSKLLAQVDAGTTSINGEVEGYKSTPNRLLIPKDDINIFGVETINFINMISIGDVKVTVSFDSGVTQKAYVSGQWVTVTDTENGMTPSTLNSLRDSEYSLIRNSSNTLRFQYWLADNASLDKISLNVNMMGREELAKTSDYTIDYNLENKTISINYSKNGTYTINYLDIIQ